MHGLNISSKEALKEDGYDNDVTTKAVLLNNFVLTGQFIAKASGVVSGVEAAGGVFQHQFQNQSRNFTEKRFLCQSWYRYRLLCRDQSRISCGRTGGLKYFPKDEWDCDRNQ